jgi:hypothetical protein
MCRGELQAKKKPPKGGFLLGAKISSLLARKRQQMLEQRELMRPLQERKQRELVQRQVLEQQPRELEFQQACCKQPRQRQR